MKTLRWCSLGLALLALGGCNKDREPVPNHAVLIRGDGSGYVLDGQPMAHDQVLAELETLANRARTSPGGAARMVLAIRTDAGVDYDRVVELIDQCSLMGINKIETGGR